MFRDNGEKRSSLTAITVAQGRPAPVKTDSSHKNGEGFSLVELMVATVLVGIGISASLFALTTSHKTIHEGMGVVTSGTLADYVKQYSDTLAFEDPVEEGRLFGPEEGENGIADFDDIDDLDGLELSPPIGADGSPLDSFSGWSMNISVVGLDPATYEELIDPSGSSIRRVDIEIKDGIRLVRRYQWIVTRA